MNKFEKVLLLSLSLCVFLGCQSLNNAVMEKVFKKEKRELLKGSVEAVRRGQEDAQQEFKDAMANLKELYGFQGGDLERMYGKLKASYDNAQAQVDVVHSRIGNMENIAKSMFAQWAQEIKQYSSPALAASSRQQLAETKDRYKKLSGMVRASQETMNPVLNQLRDHVLYLKHNLNASAIGFLKNEATDIQGQIESLIKRMNASIAEADDFIRTLPAG